MARQQFEQVKSVAGELPMFAGFRDEAGGFAVWRRADFMPKSALQQCEDGVWMVRGGGVGGVDGGGGDGNGKLTWMSLATAPRVSAQPAAPLGWL